MKELINKYNQLDKDKYTSETYDALKSAIDGVWENYFKDKQNLVDDYEENIKQAFSLLKLKTITYEYIKGANQEFRINKDSNLSFTLNIDYDEFLNSGKVYIDNNLISSENYVSKRGSTVITFNNDFVSTLKIGNHNLMVKVSNGSASTDFKLTELNTSSKEESISVENNPKTTDYLISYYIILAYSLIGLSFTSIYLKNNF